MMENLSYNYAEEQRIQDSAKITIIDSNLKTSLLRLDSLKNLTLVGIAVGILSMVIISFVGQSLESGQKQILSEVSDLVEKVEDDKINALSAKIDLLRAEARGDQTKLLTDEIKSLQSQLKALEQKKLEHCTIRFLGMGLNCTEIKS